MERVAALLVILLVMSIGTEGRKIRVSNLTPRYDTTGSIIDAHDGTVRWINGEWWMHAAQYGLCHEPARYGCDQTPDHCGFTNAHNVSIWRSPDLSTGSWEFVGQAIQCAQQPNCSTLYRPHMVYNPTTSLYVLLWNYVAPFGYAGYGVATSASPAGPFTVRNHEMNITRLCPGPAASAPCGTAQGGAGDFDVYVDTDGTAYIIYGANYYMSIEQLTPDYVYSTGRNATINGGQFGDTVFAEYFIEAPVLFKRGAIYYALFGSCCCFCEQGSGIMVHTAPHPLGPWTTQPGGDIACVPPTRFVHEGASF